VMAAASASLSVTPYAQHAEACGQGKHGSGGYVVSCVVISELGSRAPRCVVPRTAHTNIRVKTHAPLLDATMGRDELTPPTPPATVSLSVTDATTFRATPAYDIDRYRALIPLLERAIPLNNCSQAPLTTVARAAAEAFLGSWDRRGMDWDAWMAEVDAARRSFARMVNAAPEEIAVTSSVSQATSALASALRFDEAHSLRPPRDTIVASEAEFPTVGHVWMAQERSGARLAWVPVRESVVELADYERLVDDRTLLVSATHGYYLNGFVQDVDAIARLAHERGAWLFVDAYQTCGAVPIDVRAMDIDFLASGTLKYLMGTPGIAFLYVRHELIERLEPLVTGWFGRVNPFAFDAKRLDWSPTAARFDTGTPPLLSAYVSRASMDLLLEVGVRWIREWTEALSARAVEGARARGLAVHGPGLARPKSPTTSIVVRDSHTVEAHLRERGVIASARGPVIRLAPHFYNTLDEIDRALDLLADEQRP